MKTSFIRTLTFGTLLLTFSLTSCVDPYYGGGGYGGYNQGYGGYNGGGYARSTGSSTVAGALIGAGAGGIIGNQRHRGLEGAAIGGILGALAGSMMGGGQRSYPQQGYNQSYNQGGYNQGYSQPYYNQGGYSQPAYPQQSGYGYGQPTSYGPSSDPYAFSPQSNNPYGPGNWQ